MIASGDYYQTIQNYFRRRLSNEEEVRDLTQEVFLRALQSERGFDNIRNLSGWLVTIARNLLIDHYRRRSVQLGSDVVDLSGETNAEDSYTDLERCLSKFLEELDPKSARVIRLVDLEGMSQKEVAEREGVPHATIRSQVQRARKKLKNRFADICFIPQDVVGRPQDCVERKRCDC